MKKTLLIVLISLITFAGCQTIPKSRNESRDDVQSAIKSMAEVLVGKELNEEEMDALKREIRTNPEAKSAVKAITSGSSKEGTIKYCPVGGERYSARVTVCPEHNVELKPVEE